MGSMFKAKSQTQKTSSENNPWAPAQDDLKKILSEMGNWYDSAKETGYISSTGDLSGIYSQYLNALKGGNQQVQDGINNYLGQSNTANQGALGGYQNAANGGMNTSTSDILAGAKDLYNNDMVQAQIDAANKGIDRTLTEQTFTGIDRDAVGSGNMGSSRAGIAQAIAARDAAEMKTSNANTITANAYQNALNQSQSVLNNNNSNIFSGLQGMAGMGNQFFNQAGQYGNIMNSGLSGLKDAANLEAMLQQNHQQNLIGERDYIANLLGQYYLPAAGTIGGMGGTSTGKTQTPGSSTFDSILGAGQAAGSIWTAFSDVRLKENIKFVEKKGEHNYYTWDWKEEAKDLVGNQSTYGVIAQEAMEKAPESVSKHSSGFYVVDYSKLH